LNKPKLLFGENPDCEVLEFGDARERFGDVAAIEGAAEAHVSNLEGLTASLVL
jgi:hypothetical protein